MFRLAVLLGLLGLAAATAIIIGNGYASILQALQVAGWGIIWTSLFHVVPLLTCIIGWRALLPGRKRASYGFLLYVLWLRASVNNMMPVARIGGEVVSVRVMVKHGMRKNVAVASTLVELTLSVAAVFLFVISGVFLLALRLENADLAWKLGVGSLAILPMGLVLAVVQRIGFFGLCDKIFTLLLRDKWKKFAGNIGRLDDAIHAMYRRHGRVLFCFVWVLISWCSTAGESWLGLHFLDHPISLLDCFILEALVQGAAMAAFVVPGALGVQEAAFLFFGHLLGLPGEIAVALAVLRRCRDLIVFLPGLIVWQIQEGRWLLGKKPIGKNLIS